MELRHLEQIVEIRRSGSISAAARRLGLSQPALSRSIQRLEAAIGAALLDRSDRQVRLTAIGAHLADRGEELVRVAAALRLEASALARGETGRLRIGFGPATRLRPLPQVVAALAEALPGLAIEARQVSGADLIQGVQRGLYDVAFSFSGNADEFGDLIRIKLFEDKVVVAARPGHPLLSLPAPTMADVLRFRVGGFGAHIGIDPVLLRDPVARSNLRALTADDADLIRSHPLRGDGVARTPRFVIADLLAASTLIEVPVTCPVPFECWMLTTATLAQTPLLHTVARIARQVSIRISSDASM